MMYCGRSLIYCRKLCKELQNDICGNYPLVKPGSNFCMAGGSVWVTFIDHCTVSLIILMVHVIREGDPTYHTGLICITLPSV